jgi:hypothetical protein
MAAPGEGDRSFRSSVEPVVAVGLEHGAAEGADDRAPGAAVHGEEVAQPGGRLHVRHTLAHLPHREQIPAAGLLLRTVRRWSTRKQKNTIQASSLLSRCSSLRTYMSRHLGLDDLVRAAGFISRHMQTTVLVVQMNASRHKLCHKVPWATRN